jgi:hypothetical protein
MTNFCVKSTMKSHRGPHARAISDENNVLKVEEAS